MTSPLLPYANAYLLITTEGIPTITNGRVTTTDSTKYLIECYLVRQQSTGTSTGADYIPTQTSPGDVLPGVSGYVYLYSGYALRKATVSQAYNLESGVKSGITWSAITSKPSWMFEGMQCEHLQGNEQIKNCKIERLSGRYGNASIDQIINKEIGGIPIVVRSGDIIG